jgi:hypothetical protein
MSIALSAVKCTIIKRLSVLTIKILIIISCLESCLENLVLSWSCLAILCLYLGLVLKKEVKSCLVLCLEFEGSVLSLVLVLRHKVLSTSLIIYSCIILLVYFVVIKLLNVTKYVGILCV